MAQAEAATILPPPETCFQATTATSGGSGNTGTGFIGLLGTITHGTGGTSGTYFTALTGGSGTNASASVTVSGGGVTAVNLYNPGTGYVVGDTLSATSSNIGNVGGFSVPVASVSINSSLAGGRVYTYQPFTTSPKSTWFNSDQAGSHQNTNPVQLDANGCAIIYGVGSYTFVVQDSLGNTIYSQVTTDTSASNSVFWAGLAGGTPNAITVADPGFNNTGGSIISFKAIANNTGPTTITPSGTNVPLPVVLNSSIGLVPLVGGEIIQTGDFQVLYDPIAADFVLLNPTSSSGGGGGGALPVGMEISCAGFAAPANFVFEYGQALSRSTYAALYAQLTTAQTGTLNSGQPQVTNLTDTEQFAAGQHVEASGFAPGTTIVSVDSSSQVTLSNNASTTGSQVLTFFAYGNGDGSTTFNVPDKRGRIMVGRDNMGGTAASILTSTFTGASPDALGTQMGSPEAAGGGGINITQSYLPAITLGVTIFAGQGAHSHGITTFASGGAGVSPAGDSTASAIGTPTTNVATLPGMTGVTGALGGSTPISPINPGITTNWCLRVQ